MRAQKKSVHGLSEIQRRSWKAFFLVAHLVGEFVDAALDKGSVGPQSEYDVLYTLDQSPGAALTMKELAASLSFSHSGLSRMVDRLQERGLVARCGVEEDRRSVSVRLEDAGRERIAEVWKVMSASVNERFGSALTDEEHEELRRLMGKILPQLVAEKERRTKLPFLHRS